MDRVGHAVVVWMGFDGRNSRVQARLSAAGALSAVQTLSAAGRDVLLPQVAVDQDGDAVVVWCRFDGRHWRVQATGRSAAGALSAVQTLSAAWQDARDPQVAVDRAGHAVVVWQRFEGTNWRIQARRRSAAGALSTERTLSPAGQDALNPQVAVDQDGDAVLVWSRIDPQYERIQATRWPATGAPSAVQTISPAEQHAFFPQVAVDRDGDAVVVWMGFDESGNRRVQGVRL